MSNNSFWVDRIFPLYILILLKISKKYNFENFLPGIKEEFKRALSKKMGCPVLIERSESSIIKQAQILAKEMKPTPLHSVLLKSSESV